jgi:S-disulfanyl-L-cysteine oxidoreductase SoxD
MPYSQSNLFTAAIVVSASFACMSAFAQTQQARAQAPQQQPRAQTQSQPQSQSKAQAKPQEKPQAPAITGIGTPATPEDMGNLAWASGASGNDLPPGNGTAKQGAEIFAGKCAMCHGEDAHGVHWQPGAFSPIGGLPLAGPKKEGPNNPWVPPITNGAPFPEVIFNAIAVEMPMFRPGTLKADEVYSLAAFIFWKNGYIKEDDVMNRETLPQIQLPNRFFFLRSDDILLDLKKRGCYQTHGVCLGD